MLSCLYTMCGIFSYFGKHTANTLIFEGLKRLEYRGYDSWGIAVLENESIHQYKNIGEVIFDKKLKKLPDSNIGIGHTRWATHGGVTQKNAHPHISVEHGFTLVQNGMVENFAELKNELIAEKQKFLSETDTEVIVKLIERELKKEIKLKEAIKKAFNLLRGRNTIAVLDSVNQTIFAVKNGSPLVVGLAADGTFLASDSLAVSPHTNKIVVLDDFDMVEINASGINLTDIKSNKPKKIVVKPLKYRYEDIDKGDYAHFMLKEITEQEKTLLYATDYSEEELQPLINKIKKSNRVYVLGAGTAGYSAGQIAYFLRNIAQIDAQDIKSYEFNSYLPIVKKNDLIIAVSQSGETADTLEALEEFKKVGCKIASIVNMYGTTISRMSDYEYYTNAGPEICVASTKVFTSQTAWGYLLAMSIDGQYKKAQKNIKTQVTNTKPIFAEEGLAKIRDICKKIKDNEHFFVLGKGENAFIALEAALKVKEISYKHFEGFFAGELKHGVIALIEKGTPLFVIVPGSTDSQEYKDTISAADQVKARNALVIGVGNTSASKMSVFDHYIEMPQLEYFSSVTNVIPFQLVSYYLGLELGVNIDKPRNLAKSVTVK